jgi:hypothetical protein
MNTVIWTTLFTVAGTLGGVLITAIFNDRSQTQRAEETRRQDEQASAAAVADRQRDAYTRLLGTARYVLGAALEIQQEFKGLPPDREIDRSRILVQDLTQAVARVELVGTETARSGAEAIYDKSLHVGHVFALYMRQLTAAQENPGSPKPEFDSHGASEAIRDLEAEIKSFLECVRREQET